MIHFEANICDVALASSFRSHLTVFSSWQIFYLITLDTVLHSWGLPTLLTSPFSCPLFGNPLSLSLSLLPFYWSKWPKNVNVECKSELIQNAIYRFFFNQQSHFRAELFPCCLWMFYSPAFISFMSVLSRGVFFFFLVTSW